MAKRNPKYRHPSELIEAWAVKNQAKNIIMPAGSENAPLAVVGMRPNDAQHVPFDGPSHQPWREFLASSQVNNSLIWQTYLFKSEPVHFAQVNKWRQLLLDELELVKPRAVLLLGELVARHVLRDSGAADTSYYRAARWAPSWASYATFFVTHSIERAITEAGPELYDQVRQDFMAVAFGNVQHFPLLRRIGAGNAKST